MKKFLLLSLTLLTLCSCSGNIKNEDIITLNDGEKLNIKSYRSYENPSKEAKKIGAKNVKLFLYDNYYKVEFYLENREYQAGNYVLTGVTKYTAYYSSQIEWNIYLVNTMV